MFRMCIWPAFLCLAVMVLLPEKANAAWSQARSQHFTIYSNGSTKQLKLFAEKLEKFDYLLRTMTGTDRKADVRPLKVFALDSDSEVKSIAHNSNAAGFYNTSDRSAFAVITRDINAGQFDQSAQQILFHEYAHHFMLHYFPAAYPAWYVEGFAEFYSTVNFKADGSIVFGNAPMYRAPSLVLVGIYPLEKLFARETDQLGQLEGDRYYGTAWLLTHYFRYNSKRGAEFSRYLNDVTSGVPDVTLDKHFEGGAKALEKELRAYLNKRLSATVLTPKNLPAIEVIVTPVEEPQAALLKYELRLMVGMPKEERPRFIADLRVASARFPSSAHAQALLADAELRSGYKDEALAAADRAIALDPNFAPALGVRATILLDRAGISNKTEDWKAALSMIIKANRADLDDPVPLGLFYRYHAMRGGDMPQIGYDGINKAFSLLPQHPGYRFMLASALAHKKDYKMAATVMNPIAFSPHASEMREAALNLQQAFRDAEKDGKVLPLDTGGMELE
jgi:cytochrome c-type biogenesis protein CcmH/NrfG